MFFKAKTEKKEMAFGRIPAYCKYELFMERYRSAASFILTLKQGKSKLRVLDAGAGEGYLKYFCPWDWVEFIGTEIWPERLKVCESLGYQMVRHDLDKDPLPFPDGHFDAVVASHILEHLHDPERALRELYRVTAPNGFVMIGLPMHPGWLALLLKLWNRVLGVRGDHLHFFSKRSLRMLLKPYHVTDVRGFRLISARRRSNLENHEWFYTFNTWWGRHFPYASSEINAVLRKGI